MKTIKIKTTGLSLKELKEKYATGPSGFYPQSWYENEKFYTEKPEAGEYEFIFDRDLCNKTYSEQLEKLPKGYSPTHIATIAEAILIHFKETGERLLEDWYVRTSNLDSGGHRVYVGSFDSRGLDVNDFWDGSRDGIIGLSASRKLDTGTLETLESIESLPNELIINNIKYKKA